MREMRRKHSEVTDPALIGTILNSTTIGRLATNGADGYPYITPVSFVYHEGSIYFHCATAGEKLANMSRDSRVCFEVDVPLAYLEASFDAFRRACKLHQFFHCVIIRGEASILPGGPLKTVVLNALVSKHEHRASCAHVTEESPGYAACHVVQIKPVSVSAKSDLGQNRTAEERLALARMMKTRNGPQDIQTIVAMGFEPAEI